MFPPPPTPLIRRSAPPVYSRRAHQTVRACLRACEKERGLLAPRTADSTPPRAALANPPALRRAERTRTRLPPGGAIGSLRFTVPPPPPHPRQGHTVAQHNVAVAHMDGLGAPADAGLAVEWYRRAAAAGQPESLGTCHANGIGA